MSRSRRQDSGARPVNSHAVAKTDINPRESPRRRTVQQDGSRRGIHSLSSLAGSVFGSCCPVIPEATPNVFLCVIKGAGRGSKRISSNHRKLNDALRAITEWNFDAFQIDELTDQHSLQKVFLELLKLFQLHKKLPIDMVACEKYIREIEAHYKENPYHNRVHATDVLQSVGFILHYHDFYREFTDLEILAMLLAAAIHDVDHPGVNNEFHQKTNSKEFQKYETHVNERMHIDHACMYFSETQERNLLANFSQEDSDLVKKHVQDIVITTDMVLHDKLVADFQKRFPSTNGFSLKTLAPGDKTLLLQMIVHCADISNPTRPWRLCERWAELIRKEMLEQGDQEKQRGFQQITSGCDRKSSNLVDGQLFFLNKFVIPCFQAFGTVAVSFAHITLKEAQSNEAHWQRRKSDPNSNQ